MAKRRQKGAKQQAAPAPPPPVRRLDIVTLLTLVLLVAALLVSFTSWQRIKLIEESLGEHLGRIEARVSQVIDRGAGAQAQPAQQRRRGPDPDRVYDINTAGAPVRGPASAPITIAEFSDFQ